MIEPAVEGLAVGLVVSAGLQGGPRVSAIDGKTLATTRTTLFNDFFAFEQTLRDGAYIAVGDNDIYDWVSGKVEVPADQDSPVVRKLLAFRVRF